MRGCSAQECSTSQAACSCGIVIVDHGSRRKASNDMLLEFCELYRATTQWRIVEPAHMEIAEPSIQQAIGVYIPHQHSQQCHSLGIQLPPLAALRRSTSSRHTCT
jgi:hypothetical protein